METGTNRVELTLGSEIPRVWTRITRCMNLRAANLMPLAAVGDHTISKIRLLLAVSVSHMERSDRLIHLVKQ